MPNPTLYVLPETHDNKQDQERKAALEDLARWNAINVLMESALYHDTSGQSVNLYGIEEEVSIKQANLILHHINRVKVIPNLSQKVAASPSGIPLEIKEARFETGRELQAL